jgi:hypothetical protein
MIQSVEYVGFDDRPDLRRLAESATAVLADETAALTGELSAVWEYDARPPEGIELELGLHLPAASGRGARLIPLAAFADEAELRSQLRRVWEAAGDAYLAQRRAAWDELIRQPVGV